VLEHHGDVAILELQSVDHPLAPIRMVPAKISSSPAIMRRIVDSPQPDGPSTTRNSPSATWVVTPFDHFAPAERFPGVIKNDRSHGLVPRHFSVSITPLMNQRCMSTTGGSMASIATAVATFHKGSASITVTIRWSP
jgi:hypothetical protein